MKDKNFHHGLKPKTNAVIIPTKPTPPPPPTESAEQQALFRWTAWSLDRYPELELLFHIPNGGKRSKREAATFQAEGVKPGVPDLCLPVARGGYHGLYIEMKRIGGEVSDDQGEWLRKLAQQGYCTVVCYGFGPARHVLEMYLDGRVEYATGGPPFMKCQRITAAMLEAIEKALGFKLYDWQVRYLRESAPDYSLGRRSGKTTAYCIALALSKGPPILQRDLHQYADTPPGGAQYARHYFPGFFLETWATLQAAGLPVRDVITNRWNS